MYTTRNLKAKKVLKEAIARGEEITYFQPDPFGGREIQNGSITLEGPHYPESHRQEGGSSMRPQYIGSLTIRYRDTGIYTWSTRRGDFAEIREDLETVTSAEIAYAKKAGKDITSIETKVFEIEES